VLHGDNRIRLLSHALLFWAGALVLTSGCDTEPREQTQSADDSFAIEEVYKRGPVTFTVRIDQDEITIADRLRLELEAVAEDTYDVQLPEFGENLEQFAIADYDAPPPELAEGNKLVRRKAYVLEPFLSGEYKIPPMKVTFHESGNDGKTHELESEALTVQVKSILPDEMAELEIKDIAGPVAMPPEPVRWPYWFLGAALIVAAASAGIVWWLVRRQDDEDAVRRPAHEIAYEQIQRLVSRQLVEQGRVKEFYIGLSDILRHYIENRFGLRAPERTTEEFLRELHSARELTDAHKDLLRQFLRHCDMVKFAEHEPEENEIQQAFDACTQFIADTEESGAGVEQATAGDGADSGAAGDEASQEQETQKEVARDAV
jgi:hypothetical protein